MSKYNNKKCNVDNAFIRKLYIMLYLFYKELRHLKTNRITSFFFRFARATTCIGKEHVKIVVFLYIIYICSASIYTSFCLKHYIISVRY